jgi:cyclopropane fatty-acyl-phospholipid synthase-like methyltransferase
MPFSAAAQRNQEPILEVLADVLPQQGLVLEIASGSGQHAVHFAAGLPGLTWQPTDADPHLRDWIDLRVRQAGLANVRPAIALDARATPWPVKEADAIVCINMIHVSPWEATLGLLAGASEVLGKDGVLFLYGPFRRDGVQTSAGNIAFDADLRSRDPAWGLRDTRDLIEEAAARGFVLDQLVEMPANNLSLVFRKKSS